MHRLFAVAGTPKMIRVASNKSLSLFKNCSRWFCAVAREHNKNIFQRNINEVEFDWNFLTSEENRSKIQQNIISRKGVGNIDEVIKLYNRLSQLQPGSKEFHTTRQELMQQASDIPNLTHPESPIGAEDQAKTVSVHGKRREFDFKPKSIVELGALNEKLMQTSNVAEFSGPRTYHLLKEFADLESALVKYTFDYLIKKGFSILSVPDFVPTKDVEKCGFKTSGLRNQVYKVSPDLCLSGTGEMSVASFLSNEVFPSEQLPMRLATVSRCYRAETSEIEREKGLYRVHQFTKVEMFGVTESHQSDELLEEFLGHEINLFSGLDLHFRVLDMPSQELGASAFRKYDVETWLPAKGFWGEISSASNCTDYQSRRLNIRYNSNGALKFCHTINGTACAVPRMLIALMETNQQKDGSILVPGRLIPYMNNKEIINSRTRNKDK